jgi:signal transduction histidine kinase
MEPPDAQLSHEELQQQRERIRHRFLRANTAVAVILVAVLGLALAAVIGALRADRDRRRAETAERDGREKLWRSYLAQARAGRLSGNMGRRAEGLETIRAAAVIRPTLELRNEALGCLALIDLEDNQHWPVTPGTLGHTVEGSLQIYALSDTNGNITIHRLADNGLIASLTAAAIGAREGYTGRHFEFSPDDHYFAARYGGRVIVWDIAQARPIFTNGFSWLPNPLGRPHFIDGGRLLAFASAEQNGQIAIFDHLTGREQPMGRTFDGRRPFAFHPSQKLIAVAEGKDIAIWNWETGDRVRALNQDSAIRGIEWDPQGRRLACAGINVDVTLWDTATGESRLLAGHGASVWHLSFSSDGTMLLTASLDGLTRLWETGRGRLLCTTDRGYGVTFNADGDQVGFEQPMRAVGTWRVQRSPIYRTILAPEVRDQTVWNQDMTADGRWLAWARPGELRIWDLSSGKPPLIASIDDLFCVGFHPYKPALFICRDQSLELRSLEPAGADDTNAFRLGSPVSVTLPFNAHPREFVVSDNGRTLAIEGLRRRIAVLDLERPGRFVPLDSRSFRLSAQGPGSGTGSGHMALSPDGRWIAIGHGQGVPAPQIWNSRKGEFLKKLPTGPGTVVFSPDGRSLLTGSATEYVLWSARDWEPLWRLPREGIALATGAAAFARDGSLLAVASSRQRVQLLDPATGTELAALVSPDPLTITGLRLSGDGSLLAVATPQGAFQLWDIKRARSELAALNLDWGSGSSPMASTVSAKGPDLWAGPPAAIAAGLAVVVGVVVLILFVLRRHRQLIEDFARTETLATRRNRQLEMARVELMHGQKMKALGTLAAGIAHDFNNLLSVVRMSNKLIGREVPESAEVREHVSIIEQAVLQGKHVARSMLGYSRETHDDPTVAGQDVSEIVEETVALLSKEFLSGIELSLELAPHAPLVQVSRGRLEQILLNFLVNAAEAMKGQGKLKIAVGLSRIEMNGACVLRPKPAAQHVELIVADSGPGIDPHIMPRIFDPFFTTKTSGAQRGTGLGLSMVYTIAEQDGLGLGVETEPDQGTRFRLLLPVAENPKSAA